MVDCWERTDRLVLMCVKFPCVCVFPICCLGSGVVSIPDLWFVFTFKVKVVTTFMSIVKYVTLLALG